MRASQCDQCHRHPSRHATATGRRLCDQCYRDLAGATGAAFSLSQGESTTQAIVTGVAARHYAGAMDAARDHKHRQELKLAQTEGFWRRLWVRVVG
jgi:hypothetical protein